MKWKTKKLLALGLAAAMTVSGVSFGNYMGNAQVSAASTRVGDEGCLEIPGTISTFDQYNTSFLSVTGYAKEGVHDRTADLNTDKYRKVTTVAEFLQAIRDAKRGSTMVDDKVNTPVEQGKVTVIEVMNDLDFSKILGEYSDIQTEEKLKDGAQLLQTGAFKISDINLDDINGLTIFSQNGAKLSHCSLTIGSGGENIFGANDIIIRNLSFDGMWMWDNMAAQKDAGWCYMKIQQSTNIWVDHCSFTIAFDGNVDLENGSSGVTFSWCKFGMTAEEAQKEGSVVYTSIQYMEKLYTNYKVEANKAALDAEIDKVKALGFRVASDGTMNTEDLNSLKSANSALHTSYTKALSNFQKARSFVDVNKGTIYADMRLAGATPEEIMAYAAYHSKVHLVGDGDHLYMDYDKETKNGTEDGLSYEEFTSKEKEYNKDSNDRLRLTMAYDWYQNVGQRVPMIRQGVGHLYNCYIDDMDHINAANNENIKKAADGKSWKPFTMTRCINARDGASIGADTCVFYGVDEPLTGKDVQGNDIANMNPPWDSLYVEAINHALIVNSRTTNTAGNTYEGSSWDKNGVNQFTKGYQYTDKSLEKWSWNSSITHLGDTPIEQTSRNLMHCGSYDDKTKEMTFVWHKNKANQKVFTLSYLEKLLDADGNPILNGNGSPMYKPFKWSYDYEETLPYTYQLVELDDVKSVVTSNSGAGSIKFKDGSSWVRTEYEKGEDIVEGGIVVPSPEPTESQAGSETPEPSPTASQDVIQSPSPSPIYEKETPRPVLSPTPICITTVPPQEVSESPEPSPSAEVPEVMLGDVDGDKEVKLNDARMALRAALHLAVLDDTQKKAADVDGNNTVELADARRILRVALHLDSFTENKTASVAGTKTAQALLVK